jgi:hypothetical protein
LRGFRCRPHDHDHYHHHNDDEYHITSRDIAFGFLTFMIILTNLQVCMLGVLQLHPEKLCLERDHLENLGMDDIRVFGREWTGVMWCRMGSSDGFV